MDCKTPAKKEVKTTCSQWKILKYQIKKLPVEYVEDSVKSKEKHIMCCDILDLFQFINHVELG